MYENNNKKKMKTETETKLMKKKYTNRLYHIFMNACQTKLHVLSIYSIQSTKSITKYYFI